MRKSKSTAVDPNELRRRAEDRFAKADSGSFAIDKDLQSETPRLLHELQVHQIELELQNEELQRARTEAEDGLARYSDLYDLAPVGYLTLGCDGTIRKVNLTGARLLGLERSRLVGRRLALFVAAECRPVFNAFLAKLFENRIKEACEVVLHPEGEAPWMTVELTATATEDGQECRVVATDINERKRAEELMGIRLRLQEFAAGHSLRELLQKTLDEILHLTGSRVGFFHFVEADQRTLTQQAGSVRKIGEFNLDEADGLAECLHQRRTVIHNEHAKMPRTPGLPKGQAALTRELVVPVFRSDNIVAILGVGNKPTDFNADDVNTVSYLADVAWELAERNRAKLERTQLQLQLAQAQKLEALGTLAGGIAHDFNNILMGILGGLTWLDIELGESSEHHPDLQEMMALVERGADLARQLLGFARRGKYDVRALDLAHVVEKTSAMFGRMHKDINIQFDVVPGLRSVLMDHSQLEQVLLNLLVNAAQAMPKGGRLLLSAENAEHASEEGVPHGGLPGHFVKLVVADTGVGMDAATQPRIFEPFFTTKGPGQGTGLGLASVYGIIKSHSGFITVESELGKGSTFTLFLPATARPIAEKVPAATLQHGTGTILVVDDEEQIVRAYERLLRKIGYQVLTASGGRQAVEIMRQHGKEISLVVLDMIMPDMSGSQTYDALQEVAPGTKVLLSSGYSVDGQAEEMLARGCSGFIQKPFDVFTIAAKLREILVRGEDHALPLSVQH